MNEVLFQTAARCPLTVYSETVQRSNSAEILALDLVQWQVTLVGAIVKRHEVVHILGWIMLNLNAVS